MPGFASFGRKPVKTRKQAGGAGCGPKSLAVRQPERYRCKEGEGDEVGKSLLKRGFEKVRTGPKRPLSAYMFYAKEHRGDFSGSFGEVAKQLGASWKNASDSEKSKYVLHAVKAKEKYEDQVAEQGKPSFEIRKKVYAPRAPSAYIIWAKEHRHEAVEKVGSGPYGKSDKTDKPLTKSQAVMVELGRMWRSMKSSHPERQRAEQQHQQASQQHQQRQQHQQPEEWVAPFQQQAQQNQQAAQNAERFRQLPQYVQENESRRRRTNRF